MTDGILYLALGSEYEHLAAHTVAATRRNTDLPVHVLVSRGPRDAAWKSDAGVSFSELDVATEDNRKVKTRLSAYSPFSRTLFIDSDAFVQRRGIEMFFSQWPREAGIAMWTFRSWRSNACVPRIMIRALDTFGQDIPITEYTTGCFGFSSGEGVDDFFERWHAAWIRFGCGRDMPPLACLMKPIMSKRRNWVWIPPAKWFSARKLDKLALIQHDPGKGFPPEYGIPDWKPWRAPSDKPGEFERIRRK